MQILPEAMQRRLEMLFCERCQGVTLDESERAFQWRISEKDLQATKTLFLEKKFINSEWHLVNWNKRQFLSDHNTERVRRHRSPGVKLGSTVTETDTKQPAAVTVTTPDTDTDTEAETETEVSNTNVFSPRPAAVLLVPMK